MTKIESAAGPAWDNRAEYPSLSSKEFESDQAKLAALIAEIEQDVRQHQAQFNSTADMNVTTILQRLTKLQTEAYDLHDTLSSYAHCEECVDGRASEPKRKSSELEHLATKLEEALKPFQLYLTQAPQPIIDTYLTLEGMKAEIFRVKQSRILKPTLLSDAEEILITGLRASGHQAWGNLYDDISSPLKCKLETGESIGLAEAMARLRHSDENVRRIAWHGVQQAWQIQAEPCAAILNALAGWRLALARRRSHTVPVDFLTAPLHANRVERETIDAMFKAVRESIEPVRGGLRTMAKLMNKPKVDPWDLLAPIPAAEGTTAKPVPFADAIKMIRDIFAEIDPELGDFVQKMHANKWLEGRILPDKRQGAFCTGFAKSRTPRVFMTFAGSMSDVKTLAHEIGHSYHSWVMRDLPRSECSYPMTLAETASIFAETALRDGLKRAAQTYHEKLAIGWQDADRASGFIINIPARFDFECQFYEQRAHKKFSVLELSDLTDKVWRGWYGDSLSQTERMFWATKLHFYFSDFSFYNFPYTFGYLFSLRVYALRQELGNQFMPVYKKILRDTGRMTAEELVKTHLNEDIRDVAFWRRSLKVIETQVGEFQALALSRPPVPGSPALT